MTPPGLHHTRPHRLVVPALVALALLALQLPAFVGLAAEPAIVSDAFSRSQTNGWGTADVGGQYTPENWASHFSVAGGVGSMVLANAGASRAAVLDTVSARDVDARVRVRTDKAAAGNAFYSYLVLRRNGNNAYRPKVIFYPNGSVAVHSGVQVNNSESSVAPPVTVAGLNHAANTFIWLRGQVTGANPTTIRVKAWADGQSEPAAWHFVATNSVSAVQTLGSVGLRAYVSSITNAPVAFSFDDYRVDPVQDPTATPTPTPTTASTPTAGPTATPTPPGTIALDSFTRMLTNSWGTAEIGGVYSYFGPQADFDVGSGQGHLTLPSAGSTRVGMLNSVWGREIELSFSALTDKPASGSGLYIYGALRVAADGSAYRPKVRIASNGDVYAHVGRQTTTGETSIGTAVRVPGIVHGPGVTLRIRAQATGTNPTTVRIRVWLDGQAEPGVWHFTATDSTPVLQQPGSVRLLAYLSSDASNAPLLVSLDDFAVTTTDPPPLAGSVLVGAGDIASCTANTDEATAAVLDGIDGAVFTLGDNVYPDATAAEFANCYDPTWGRHKARTRPVTGNHEYHSPQAAPYFNYFGAVAGEPDKGYYAYDVGSWRVYALNSNCALVSCTAGSTQEQWLRADLAANPRECVAAMWHNPRFTSGVHGSDANVQPFWQALYDAGAELVLAGHDHNYERFGPMNGSGGLDTSAGIRSFVVGTGGIGLRSLGALQPQSEASQSSSHGVLKLTLGQGAFAWEFVPIAGRTYTDRGSGTCH